MPPPRFETGISNPNQFGGIRTAPAPLSVFEQAGQLQSGAATGGAEAEIEGLQQAIQQLMQMQGQGPSAFTQAGLGALEGVQQGSTIGGFGDRLNQIIGGDQFQGLVGERQRGLQGQLAAGGLTRSGTAIEAASAIPTDLAFQLENQLFGRQSGLAGMGFQGEQAGIGRDFGLNAQIAALLGGQGQVRGEGIRGAAEAEAGGILGEAGFQFSADQQDDQNQSNLFSLLGAGAGGFLGGAPGASIGAGIGSLFSDPRLKTNVKSSGKIGPLDLITWDWIEEAKATIVGNYRTFGFMSTQIKEFFPEFVSEYGGYDVVNYSGLMEVLEDG